MNEDGLQYDYDHERPTVMTCIIDLLFTAFLVLQSVIPFLAEALLFWLTPFSSNGAWGARFLVYSDFY